MFLEDLEELEALLETEREEERREISAGCRKPIQSPRRIVALVGSGMIRVEDADDYARQL
jgi:hypothetical protein